MHRVRMLQHFGVTPYLVFDGDYLPSKAATEAARAKRREESRSAGLELHRLGKVSQAYLELQKAVDVSPEMARQLIDELKRSDVQFVVAPYEADVQLAFLEREGHISAIISEDSDMLVFGAQCLLTKLDQYGDCVEINRRDFTACREISLVGWSESDFRTMAILSGCDYLASINKMGLKTAYRLIRKHKTIDRIIRSLQFDGQFRVPNGYLKDFRQAELTFLHQWVFCPNRQILVMNTELTDEAKGIDLGFLGEHVPQEVAIGVATGQLNPTTKKPLEPRNKAMPIAPWNSKLRNGRALSTGDIQTIDNMKGSKSINSFFKSKRIPLAELDPNSFTLSPRQQRTLEQNAEAIWSSNPSIGQASLQRSTGITTVQEHPANRSGLGGNLRRSTGSNTPISSSARPKKRVRLCSDEFETGTQKTQENEDMAKSRYFASSAPEPSPTTRKSSPKRKNRKTDVYIFSDDSIEDELARLPDFSSAPGEIQSAVGSKNQKKKFEDGQSDQPSFPTRSEPLGGINNSKTGKLVPATDGTIDTQRSKIPGGRAVEELNLLKAKSSYTCDQPIKSGPGTPKLTKPEDPKDLGLARPADRFQTAKPSLNGLDLAKSRNSALQRLRGVQTPRVQPQNLSQNETVVDTPSRGNVLKLDHEPSKPSNGERNLPEPTRNGLYGSEDHIIPDSDQEDSSLSPTAAPWPSHPSFDLSRFAFMR